MGDLGIVLGLIALWFGIIFCVLGVLGVVRFPDVYTRIHASGKVAMLGLVGLLIGAAFLLPATTLKVGLLIIFLVITSPVSSHAIAEAAYRSGVPMRSRTGEPLRDDLAEKRGVHES
jgi:multicomponent Na+:H+ antiporter subunit G